MYPIRLMYNRRNLDKRFDSFSTEMSARETRGPTVPVHNSVRLQLRDKYTGHSLNYRMVYISIKTTVRHATSGVVYFHISLTGRASGE